MVFCVLLIYKQVDEKDSLPKNVCWDCYSKLEQCSNFVNNSQNAQITLSQKIFAMYDDQSLMKEENVFTQDAIFHQSTNLLNFGSQQVCFFFVEISELKFSLAFYKL